MNKNIVILGSTGSIGTQALEVVENLKNINIIGLSTNTNIDILEKQIRKFNPQYVCVMDSQKANVLKNNIKDTKTEVFTGQYGLIKLATLDSVHTVLNSLVGNIGLLPTIYAIKAKKHIALANKETLVSAGELVMKEALKTGVAIYPIDSEHSAIFQCLQDNTPDSIEKIILTASGGPFRDFDNLDNVTLKQALNHPNWSMGKKITIDSATLMNKGLEVIEAKWLFDIDIDKIHVVIHPQSIIHSMVEYKDSAIMAQLGTPDMKVPIQYALSYPKRIANNFEKLDFLKHNTLTFKQPNYELFPCLKYAFDAIKIGGTMPCILNASNEIAVSYFLEEKIKFTDIPKIIHNTMKHFKEQIKLNYSLEDVLDADKMARQYAKKIILNNNF